ncbi:formyltetrahydrofolate deformylase [Gulosibacter chungangensis]|uniref:Formyltetrahydrofolate deformylase n=1 Tax=Gulosibacter chungangensis TaxID=979746 RepID=A0A7J5B870_9MICO|nr:formyltetrahydrofolate deformylase [Gulosibacter chungangensis]KAB1641232.1 formyltetrahydrofolate deformylase [Gulosibacter chungangensis]
MTATQPTRGTLPQVIRRDQATLLVSGADRQGLVTEVSSVLADFDANIISLDQHSDDPFGGNFFQRTVFTVTDFEAKQSALEAALEDNITEELGLTWQLIPGSKIKRVAILASKADHCLLDLLWRQRRGDIPMSVAMVISNHVDVAADVRQFNVPFFHVPSAAGSDKSAAEAEIVKLLEGNVDLVVLARYMQILSPEFLDQVGVPIINIHHSFLPAFIGAAPYRKAKERGVKLIGATAHYVTADLDEGPIIDQDVVRVTHADTAADLQRRGADVERQVLARAVTWHCEDRVMLNGHETVVFSN